MKELRRKGRKQDPVWEGFHRISIPNRKRINAECKACGHIVDYQGKLERLYIHLEKCLGEPTAKRDRQQRKAVLLSTFEAGKF